MQAEIAGYQSPEQLSPYRIPEGCKIPFKYFIRKLN